MRKYTLAAIVAVIAALVATTLARADEWNKTFTISGNPELRVETSDGDVTVKAGDTKNIEARVTTSGWRIGPDEVRVIDRQSGDRVELEVRLPRYRWNFGHRSVRIELTVPRQTNLEIRTSDGNITAEGVKGQMRLSTGDGNIRAESLEGALDANTGDGNLTVEGRFDRLNLKSGDGRVDARVNSGSKMAEDWFLRSGDGDVTVRLPGNFAADLNLHTGDGHIQIAFPLTVSGSMRESDIHGKLNGGGLTLSVHTGDGSIHVERL
jgi:hypothetical protein